MTGFRCPGHSSSLEDSFSVWWYWLVWKNNCWIFSLSAGGLLSFFLISFVRHQQPHISMAIDVVANKRTTIACQGNLPCNAQGHDEKMEHQKTHNQTILCFSAWCFKFLGIRSCCWQFESVCVSCSGAEDWRLRARHKIIAQARS